MEMSAWFGNLLGNLLSTDTTPEKVIEVKLDRYHERTVIAREDSIVLYDGGGQDQKYEIVMHRPFSESVSQAYSLFRTTNRAEGERRFDIYKARLPLLCSISNPNQTKANLQKFCAAIKDHPTWSLCHFVVLFNLSDCLQNSDVLLQVNSSDALTGVSPLLLAVENNNSAMVTKLLQNGASLDHVDLEGNTVFHYAASTTKEIIMLLVKDKESNLLNVRNTQGQTPLHIACANDKPECVKALLMAGADVNQSSARPGSTSTPPGVLGDMAADIHSKLQAQEMKYGGTPLHWSSSKEVIDTLLDRHCDINAVNFDMRTALHIMVLRNRLECCVALLSREADPNLCDSEGNTALHYAASEANLPIIQALIVFGADLNILNHKGVTPRHMLGDTENGSLAQKRCLFALHAVGAERCSRNEHPDCSTGCIMGGSWEGVPPLPPSSPVPSSVQELLESALLSINKSNVRRGGRVLCLDGGGIRGLVLVVLLLHLEKAVGKPIIHCFDWLAATSTGAILALALAAGKSLHECLCLYFTMKDQAFAGFRPYSSEPLETMLKQNLGIDTKMSHITHPKLMITGCLADRKPVDLHLFRNYAGANEMLDNGQAMSQPLGLDPLPLAIEQPIWEAARASGAAPSYFRPFGRFVDGGLISNNPTLDALTEIHEYNTALEALGRGHEAVPPSLVVSIGTGSVPVTQLESMDIFWPAGFWDTAKVVSGVRSMQAILVDQATQADGRVVERARAICSMLGVPYFRFSPQMSEDIVMDEKNDVKLVNLLWETKAYITSQEVLVQKLATLLNN